MGKEKQQPLPNGYHIDQPVFVEGYRINEDGSEDFCRRLGGRVMGGPNTDEQAVTVKLDEDIPTGSPFSIKHPVTFSLEPQWVQVDADNKQLLRYQVVTQLPILETSS